MNSILNQVVDVVKAHPRLEIICILMYLSLCIKFLL